MFHTDIYDMIHDKCFRLSVIAGLKSVLQEELWRNLGAVDMRSGSGLSFASYKCTS